ncbi:ABC transporter ATP-binding protein [Brooklawnia cerclae]|uniref:ATP-binding cassette subfamily B protein n=1 Tax=Brooklawnia cerclae TaxID=349934 RepID=A0ABX0SK56_9ACTN|nr:ABC transporter ATP-binding protein [Brooklawnia cerclae]NIH58758.1 ATP-binding cassette subfamily B protein [Brooklawnia cerclae]
MRTEAARRGLLALYLQLLTARGQTALRRSLALSAVSGILQGTALVLLLPASVALSTGEPCWGLGFAGWLWVFAGLALASGLVAYVNAIIGYTAALDMIESVQTNLGNRIAKLPLGWFQASSAGHLSRMVTQQMMMLGESLAHLLAPTVTNSTCALVMVVGSWAWDWRLGLVLTIAAPVFWGFLKLAQRCLARGKQISEPAEIELGSRIVEFAQSQGALRACGRATSFTELDQANTRALAAQRKDLWWSLLANLLHGMLGQIIVVTLIVLAAHLATGGLLGATQAIAFIGLCLRFTTTLEEVGSKLMGVEDRRPMLHQVDDVLSAPALPEPDSSAPTPTAGTVEFRHVGFGYVPGTPVLTDVSFHVPASSMCALVGPSGSGKTTIAKLVARFHDAGEGSVLVAGADVRGLTVADLMAQLSMVFQDVYLFDDTLEANIRIGRPDASEDDLREAARLAGVTEIVDRLPDGWRTRVGEGGRALSGGERQRVSVARALLKQAPIVLLDEATSSLDPENEANIVASMEQLRRTSTLIVIAHKLDTIRTADQIVVLDSTGSIAAIGTHDELIDRQGPYRDFWRARESAQGWQLV